MQIDGRIGLYYEYGKQGSKIYFANRETARNIAKEVMNERELNCFIDNPKNKFSE